MYKRIFVRLFQDLHFCLANEFLYWNETTHRTLVNTEAVFLFIFCAMFISCRI